MHHYLTHGLRIDSSLPLPELLPGEGPVDLTIEKGTVESRPIELDEQGRGFWRAGDRACYTLAGAGSFLVVGGRKIVVEADPRASGSAIRLPLLGPALALALHQRGRYSLHASAVAVGQRAVVVMGGIGWGKSTTAAALVAGGCRLVADDLTTFHQVDGEAHVESGYPQIKLWPDAARAIGISPESLRQVHPDHEKRAWRVEESFSTGPVPLRRFYLLDGGDRISVEPLSRVETLEAVLHNWYGARFGRDLFANLDLRRHFLAASHLVRDVPARRLRRPASLAGLTMLEQVREAIRHDLEQDAA